MTKKLERQFRTRRLSADEIAHDEEIRRKVEVEFPPAKQSTSAPGGMSAALKEAIRKSDRSVYQIAQEAGVSQIVVSRFVSGERDIRMATADKLATVLGLKLTSAA